MIGLLLVGLVANECIRPVHPRHHEPAPTGSALPAGVSADTPHA